MTDGTSTVGFGAFSLLAGDHRDGANALQTVVPDGHVARPKLGEQRKFYPPTVKIVHARAAVDLTLAGWPLRRLLTSGAKPEI